MRRTCVLSCVVWVCVSVAPLSADDGAVPGRTVEDFRLQDFRGAWHELGDFAERKFVVVAFVGTECPLAKHYGARLAELAEEYADRGVGFVGIDANQQDSLTEMAHYARVHRIEFPLLKDGGNVVADRFGAERTPEVFVLDGERVVRYRGRVDDQYGVGYSRSKPQRRELAAALDELLAGKEVSTPQTEVAGCHIGRVSKKPPRGDITYTKDVAPILQKHCVSCHRPGEIAPFALTSHDEVAGWTATIRDVVEQQRMPPWHANPAHGTFANDRSLPEEAKQRLLAWIENGAPRGDDAAPTAPTAPTALPKPAEFPEGWQIRGPDLVLEMPKSYTVPAKGVVEYQYFAFDETFDEDRWVVAAEARPGNRSVVHHLVLFYVPPGYERSIQEASLFNALAAFAPGMPAWEGPPGLAKRVPANSKLYLQVHYTPNGSEQSDRSLAGLVFAKPGTVEKQLRTHVALNYRFAIPPGARDFTLEATTRIGQDMQLVSLLPHMHLRGKAFRYEARFPDGRHEVLLDVPRYDFNWQNFYILAEPLRLPEGTEIHCAAAYDNSEDNLSNPDPRRPVTWGDQTWDEMMVGQFETVLEEQDLRLGLPEATPLEGAEGEYKVRFRYKPRIPASAVYLAGTFNEWKTDGHAMSGPDDTGMYSTDVVLKAGTHEYKFVIDGTKWRADPGNAEQTGFYQNSVLRVGRGE